MKQRIVKSNSNKLIPLSVNKFLQNVTKVLSNDLLLILLFCGIFRLYYYSYLEATISNDSPDYLNYHANILLGQVDSLRTPVYPYFIKFINLFSEEKSMIQNICIAQSIISFLTIILFYRILKYVFKTRVIINIATVIYAISPPLLNFDRVVLTESMSVSFIVIFLSLFITYLKKPTIVSAIFFTSFSFIAIMLRPAFMVLIPILTIFWILRIIYFRKDFMMAVSGIIASAFCILLVFGYAHLNAKRNGVNAISCVTNINQLSIIILDHLYEKGNDPNITADIKKYVTAHKEMLSHSLHYDKVLLSNFLTYDICGKYPYVKVRKFIINCISNQPMLYIGQRLRTAYDIRNTSLEINYADRTRNIAFSGLAKFFLELSFVSFFLVYILLFADVIWVSSFFFKPADKPWFASFLLAIILVHLAVIIFGAQDEYQRLFVVAHPLIIIVFFSFADTILYSIDKQRLLNYKLC